MKYILINNIPTPREAAITIISQIAFALKELHDRGIIHRNIHPNHIYLSIIDDKIKVKLGGFNLASSEKGPVNSYSRDIKFKSP